MIKKLSMIILALAFIAGCTSGMSKEEYISAMSDFGCKHIVENTADADKYLSEKGYTSEKLNSFRKKMKPEESLEIASEIAKRVMACHGVKLPAEK